MNIVNSKRPEYQGLGEGHVIGKPCPIGLMRLKLSPSRPLLTPSPSSQECEPYLLEANKRKDSGGIDQFELNH